MAKSKSGGTRSYLRGRVGADVYSVGRDAAGKKQQVVRSLAETVANPQTLAQMRGRMIMSTVMQAVSGMARIIDHSFDGLPSGQPSISEFIKRNYALIKADVAAHPASGNAFALNEYQEKGVKYGAYVIAAGSALVPAALAGSVGSPSLQVDLTEDTLTVGGLKAAIGVSGDYYYTLCGISVKNHFIFGRFKIDPSLADSTAITSANVASIFLTEGTAAFDIRLSSNSVLIGIKDSFEGDLYNVACAATILSQDAGNGWIHSNATLTLVEGFTIDDPADDVLPTYPQGMAEFLNGGEL